ncbi:MAG: pilus assembly protein PilP [Rhizobacter sp.]|nr:pilus assembly protein PilP [Rhizobacter sp.]
MRLRHGLARWSTLVIALLLAGLSAAAPAGAAPPSMPASAPTLGPGHLDVSDAEAAGLLRAVADVAKVNLVVAVPLDERRLSLTLRYASIDDLLAKLATALDLQLTVQGRVIVMHPRCERAVRDARDGLASSVGGEGCWRGKLAVQPVPSLSASSRPALAPHGHCPYRAPSSEENARVCEPLELFPLGSLVMRGHMEWSGRWRALIESPDGLLHAVGVQHYMGRDFGRIQSIGADGLILSEIIQNDKDEWVEVRTQVKRGVKTRLPPERLGLYYLGASSPQQLYDKAVNDLLAFVETVAATPGLCREPLPQAEHALDQAAEHWRARNAAPLDVVERHARAHVERLAQDFELSPWRVFAHERDRRATARARAFEALGKPGGDAVQAHCKGYLAKLQGSAFDLQVLFPSELQRLRSCREDRTCYNLPSP